MVQIENAAYQQQGKGSSQTKKQMLRIDLAPMVDLGLLLITFFVFTTTISSPMATDLYMPNDKLVTDSSELPKSLALILLLDDYNKIYFYNGNWEDAMKTNEVFETSLSTWTGIGKVIREKQKDIEVSGRFPEGKKGLMLLIKPTSKTSYKNVIDALDEVMINDVKKYAIIEPSNAEISFLKARKY